MQDASAMFKSFLLVLIGVVLVPVIQQLCNDANVTGATATIVAIIPLLFSLGILWSQAKTLF
jgi:membrane protein DedA with SNARE-associated domain